VGDSRALGAAVVLVCGGEEGRRTAEHEQARRMRDFNDVPNVKRDVPAATAQFNTQNR